jgi:hypothetical protein
MLMSRGEGIALFVTAVDLTITTGPINEPTDARAVASAVLRHSSDLATARQWTHTSDEPRPASALSGQEDETIMYEYIIKFIIGASPRKPEVLAPAYYWTAVNIYNASPCKDATLNWKVARALPGLQVGSTTSSVA